MKKIILTIKEWYLFKQTASFFFEFSYENGNIIIQADAHQLELLGY